ncbi:MAG: iron ABC transporter permease [Gammaproteobacteria bacterium]|nr:iron ABC transporter permease [Gammaproteobacteria bacterium]
MQIAYRSLRKLPLPSGWTVTGAVMTLILLVPIGAICIYLFAPSENWSHLVDTVLLEYVVNSLWLMLGVTLGAGGIGVTTAWLTSMCRFPGRDLLSWLLLLPLAMPAYIIAYTYTGMLDVSGPLQGWIREAFGLSYGQYWFPEVRSIGGAIIMFSLVLYPYVYMLARAAFIGQSICVLEVSRTLGCNRWVSFSKVAVPLARPAIVAGLSLALMETLADFGTVQYFGVSTFTTGIYRTWFGMFDAVAATQLSAILLFFVFGLIMLERWSRRRAHFHHTTNRYQRLPDIPLTRGAAAVALIACVFPLLFGFIVPTVQLIIWALQTWNVMLDHRFFDLVWHSFTLAAGAAVVALIPALVLAYGNRINPSRAMRFFSRLSSMGYAIPGTVIAVGVLIPFGALDNMINDFSKIHYDMTVGLFFSGTVFILLFAYTVRFLSVSLQSVEAGLDKVRPSMDDAARSMGSNRTTVLRHVHLPIIKGSLLTAIVIVFVDVMKELPATLILRPFDFNTLAVRAYELASDERLADSSTAALAIVAIGIIPVILLSRAISRSRAGAR